MNLVTKLSFMVLGCMFVVLSMASNSSAREVVTIQNAKGGQYSILAYNNCARNYYQLNGALSSDQHQVNIPEGYASSVTVALGRAVGTRNLYEKRDPNNPIYKVTKKTTLVLDIQYAGKGSAPKTTNSFGDALTNGLNQGFERKPPQ